MNKVIAAVAICAAGLIGLNSTLMPATFAAPYSITAQAEEESVTIGELTFTKYEDYAEVTKCAEDATEVVIPAEVDGLPVTSIGEGAFQFCTSLTSITILNPDCEINDTETTIFVEDVIIKGYDGSTAQAYAEKYNHTFESLGAAPERPSEPVTEPTEPVTEPTEEPTEPTEAEQPLGDLTGDSAVNASDAAIILQYSAAVGGGNTDAKIEDFIRT